MAGMEGQRPTRTEAAFQAGNTGRSNDIVPTGEGNNWYEQDIPHQQLVATIRGLLAQDQEQTRAVNLKREEGHKFLLHPFWRLHFHLWKAEQNSPIIMKGDMGYLSPKGEFFRDVRNAWDTISYDFYPEGSEEKRQVEGNLRFHLATGWLGDKPPFPLILKDKRQVALLDAMAEAVNIPHQRGQRIIPLPSSIR